MTFILFLAAMVGWALFIEGWLWLDTPMTIFGLILCVTMGVAGIN